MKEETKVSKTLILGRSVGDRITVKMEHGEGASPENVLVDTGERSISMPVTTLLRAAAAVRRYRQSLPRGWNEEVCADHGIHVPVIGYDCVACQEDRALDAKHAALHKAREERKAAGMPEPTLEVGS